MARKTVVAIECGRCKRVEHVETENAPASEAPALIIKLRGCEPITYDDLCVNCTEVVRNILDNLAKPMEKKSPVRKKKDEQSVEPTPDPPAPRPINGHVRGPRG